MTADPIGNWPPTGWTAEHRKSLEPTEPPKWSLQNLSSWSYSIIVLRLMSEMVWPNSNLENFQTSNYFKAEYSKSFFQTWVIYGLYFSSIKLILMALTKSFLKASLIQHLCSFNIKLICRCSSGCCHLSSPFNFFIFSVFSLISSSLTHHSSLWGNLLSTQNHSARLMSGCFEIF